MPTGRFLARVEFLKPDMPTRFARLRPIYQVDDQAWCPVEDGDSRFHDEGLVFWWVPPSMVANDTLWVVTLAPAPNYGFDHRHKDRWQVAEASRPYQAMTLYGVNGPRAFRRTLASGRLSFEAPVIGLPLIRVAEESGHWISLPESFKASKQNGRTLLTVTGLEGVIAVYSVNAGSFEQVVVDGHQYLLLLDPSIPIGYQCVASDAQLIEHLRQFVHLPKTISFSSSRSSSVYMLLAWTHHGNTRPVQS